MLYSIRKIASVSVSHRVVAAILCIVLIGSGVTFSLQWFSSIQSADTQTLTLAGEDVTLGLPNDAFAGSFAKQRSLATTSLAELAAFMGHTPSLPAWLPDGWKTSVYNVCMDDVTEDLTVIYEKEGEALVLTYNLVITDDVTSLVARFNQDGTGKSIHLNNGREIYLTANENHPTAIWSTDISYSCIAGPVSEQDICKMALSVK